MGSIHSSIQQASEKPQPTCCVHSVQGTGLPLQSTCMHTCGCTGQPRIKAAWGRGNTFFSLMACEPLTRCPMYMWPIQNDKVQHTASGMEKSLTGSQPCMPAWSNEPLPTQPISRGCAFQPRKRPGHPAQHRPSNRPLPTPVHLPLCSHSCPSLSVGIWSETGGSMGT